MPSSIANRESQLIDMRQCLTPLPSRQARLAALAGRGL
jgi:hypothetical protein